jgi:hypothetical protein
MANRYDRDPDDYGFGRRTRPDEHREDDEQRRRQSFAQGNRPVENRPYERQNPWRETRHDADRHDQDYRGTSGRDGWRDNSNDNDYYAGRDSSGGGYYGSGYYGSGRDDSGHPNDRGNFDRNRGRGEFSQNERYWHNDRNRQDRDQPGYRGIYQESAWTRDPSSGNIYGYEYSSRLDPRRFNAGDESGDRWRGNVQDQNRRFDIDRGWYTPGTSGYGNDTGARNYQDSRFRSRDTSGRDYPSQFGRGPKGYTRSDERIREDICDRLSDDDEVDARDITVTVKNAEVTLEGTINDRRSKHRAEDIAESVSGVKDVSNHLRARKGLFQELGDKISGDDDAEHHGHRGTGTRNSVTGQAPQKTSH